MDVGQHVAFFVDDHAGTTADNGLLDLLQTPPEELGHQAVVGAVRIHIGRALHIDNAGHHPLDGLDGRVAADIQGFRLREVGLLGSDGNGQNKPCHQDRETEFHSQDTRYHVRTL